MDDLILEGFIDSSFLGKDSSHLWSKEIVEKIFKILEEFEDLETEKSKERNFTEYSLKLKMAYNNFQKNVKDLPMIMNCRAMGDKNSHFGGEECAAFANEVFKACEKYLSYSSEIENFKEGEFEYFVLQIREKARRDEKYAWDFEKETKKAYLATGIDNTLEIVKE